jgi:hypothetical protein
MKSIARQAAAGVLTLAAVLTGVVRVGGDSPTARNQGCLGETWHVTMDRHAVINTKINEMSLPSSIGTPEFYTYDLSISGTYVSELHDTTLLLPKGVLRTQTPRWISRTIDWSGQYSAEIFGCYSLAREAGGHLELGATDDRVDTLNPWQQSRMQWKIKPEIKLGGSCFLFAIGGSDPVQLPFPKLRGNRDILRGGCCYSAVDKDGTHYSERVEQRGNENLNIRVAPQTIVPNQSGKGDASNWVPTNPDEATSEVTVTATCDGKALSDRQIGLRIDVEPNSGHHNHVDANHPRPRGKLADLADGQNEADCGFETGAPSGTLDDTSCITVKTNKDGEAKVKFKSPLTGSVDNTKKGSGPYMSGIAGDYEITAKDAYLTEVRAGTTVHVKIKSCDEDAGDGKCLKQATFNTNLEKLRSNTSAHPEGSYLTPGTQTAFSSLADRFHKYQADHKTALAACKDALKGTPASQLVWPIVSLSVNDIALPDGGIFDLDKDWQPGHYTHSKGQGGDFNRFGASLPQTWENGNIVQVDCDAKCNCQPAVTIIWYMQTLIELGKIYGKWDCSDLGAPSNSQTWRGHYPVFSPDKCAAGEIPTGKSVISPVIPPFQGPPSLVDLYFPPLLHLHVED